MSLFLRQPRLWLACCSRQSHHDGVANPLLYRGTVDLTDAATIPDQLAAMLVTPGQTPATALHLLARCFSLTTVMTLILAT